MRRLALLLLLAPIACVHRVADPVLHVLHPLPASGTAEAAGPVLELMAPRLPEVLQQSKLVLETGGRVDLIPGHRWANDLDEDLRRVLAADLAARLGAARVAPFPEGRARGATHRLAVDVLRLAGRPGGALVFEGTWTLTAATDGKAVLHRPFRLEEPVKDGDVEALVAAHDRALAALAQAITEALRQVAAP